MAVSNSRDAYGLPLRAIYIINWHDSENAWLPNSFALNVY